MLLSVSHDNFNVALDCDDILKQPVFVRFLAFMEFCTLVASVSSPWDIVLESGDDCLSFSGSVVCDCLPLSSGDLLRPFASNEEDLCAVVLMLQYN